MPRLIEHRLALRSFGESILWGFAARAGHLKGAIMRHTWFLWAAIGYIIAAGATLLAVGGVWEHQAGGTIVDLSRTWLGRFMLRRHWGGFTAGRCVLLWQRSSQVIVHEFKHVDQGRRLGIFFPPAYGIELVRHGYRLNKYEIEARKAAGQE